MEQVGHEIKAITVQQKKTSVTVAYNSANNQITTAKIAYPTKDGSEKQVKFTGRDDVVTDHNRASFSKVISEALENKAMSKNYNAQEVQILTAAKNVYGK